MEIPIIHYKQIPFSYIHDSPRGATLLAGSPAKMAQLLSWVLFGSALPMN